MEDFFLQNDATRCAMHFILLTILDFEKIRNMHKFACHINQA